MTPEAQRIAIAEACGWKQHPNKRPHLFGPAWESPDGRKGFQQADPKTETGEGYLFPPDYLDDLNAMHEAEKVLTAEQWFEYDRILPLRPPQTMHCNAAQRAESFLRAIGKWQDAT